MESYRDLLISIITPIIESWPLMSSPYIVGLICCSYLIFVLKVGPNFMKNRKAYDLKTALIVYNVYQIICNIYICSFMFRDRGDFFYYIKHSCAEPLPHSELATRYLTASWWYFFSKVVDLLDTIFFVLRKKPDQVTFLHVYHHSSVLVVSWIYLKYIPGPQAVLLGFTNSVVHVFMYFYYLVSALGPEYSRYLWWKKHMTSMQIGQFALMMIYLFSIVLRGCELPKLLTYFLFVLMGVFLVLFIDLYKDKYFAQSKEKKGKLKKLNCLETGDEKLEKIN